MGRSKLTRLKQFQIEKPCPEDWDKMEGDERQRFCAGCGCYVNNVEAMTADEAEELLAGTGKKCVRATVNSERGILTKDGWIPRLLLASAIATMASGCETNAGEASYPTNEPNQGAPKDLVKPTTGSSNPDDVIVNSVILGGPIANTALARKMRDEKMGNSKYRFLMGDTSTSEDPKKLAELIKKAEKKRQSK